MICEKITYNVDESILNRIYYFEKYNFKKIATNNKTLWYSRKVDRFVYENVWYFQVFSCEVFVFLLIKSSKRDIE